MRQGEDACAVLRRDGRHLLGTRSARRRAYPNARDVIGRDEAAKHG
jgi:hypothetical protein